MAVVTGEQVRWTALIEESIIGQTLEQTISKADNNMSELLKLAKIANIDKT